LKANDTGKSETSSVQSAVDITNSVTKAVPVDGVTVNEPDAGGELDARVTAPKETVELEASSATTSWKAYETPGDRMELSNVRGNDIVELEPARTLEKLLTAIVEISKLVSDERLQVPTTANSDSIEAAIVTLSLILNLVNVEPTETSGAPTGAGDTSTVALLLLPSTALQMTEKLYFCAGSRAKGASTTTALQMTEKLYFCAGSRAKGASTTTPLVLSADPNLLLQLEPYSLKLFDDTTMQLHENFSPCGNVGLILVSTEFVRASKVKALSWGGARVSPPTIDTVISPEETNTDTVAVEDVPNEVDTTTTNWYVCETVKE